MQDQINFSRSAPFQAFMAGLTNVEGAQQITHGIYIELHPTWRGIIDRQRARDSGLFPSDAYYAWPAPSQYGANGPYRVSEVPDEWHFLIARDGKSSPFLVKIYVLPTTTSTLQQRGVLEDYARAQPFYAVVIDEPLPVLASNVEGGEDIKATVSGTLGGFLKDDNGQIWGMTCGHVAQVVGEAVSFEDLNGKLVPSAGSTVHTNYSSFRAIKSGDLCSQYINAGQVEADLALIDFGSTFSPQNSVEGLGQVDGILKRQDLGSGSIVQVKGAITGPHTYEIQGYGVTQKVHMRGTSDYFCFANVYDFCVPTSNRIQRAIAPLPVQGDSGAWVLFKKSHAYGLHGMLFAVEGARGIAAFAESLAEWADDKWSVTLKVM